MKTCECFKKYAAWGSLMMMCFKNKFQKQLPTLTRQLKKKKTPLLGIPSCLYWLLLKANDVFMTFQCYRQFIFPGTEILLPNKNITYSRSLKILKKIGWAAFMKLCEYFIKIRPVGDFAADDDVFTTSFKIHSPLYLRKHELTKKKKYPSMILLPVVFNFYQEPKANDVFMIF